jgi:hypothetical protein
MSSKQEKAMANHKPFLDGRDIPIVKLVQRNERKVNTKYFKRIEASIRAIGLIDPLIVYPTGDSYEILDGCIRYRILLEMGVETVPCLIGRQREAFTGNRMVNPLSNSQEMRMIRKSLEELDEKTIAATFGMTSIGHRLNTNLIRGLDPSVQKAFEASKINLQCAKELALVKQDRQAEIIRLMESCNDYSVTFARGLVLKTPAAKRAKLNGKKSPWARSEDTKSDLLKKLQEAQQQQDFYTGLYRQYSTNLLKLVIYARSLLNNLRVSKYMQENHPDVHRAFSQVVQDTEG